MTITKELGDYPVLSFIRSSLLQKLLRQSNFFGPATGLALLCVICFSTLIAGSLEAAGQESEIEQTMARLLDAASGRNSKFQLRAVLQIPFDGHTQDFLVDVLRDGQDFDVSLVNPEYMMTIRRRADGTALALPKHKVVFIGTGKAAIDDHLGFEGLAVRMISSNCALGQFAPIMLTLDPKMVLKMAQSSMGAKIENQGKSLNVSGMQIRVTKPNQIAATVSGIKLRAGLAELNQPLATFDDWPDYRVDKIDRSELERTLFRGFRRATEIVLPGAGLKTPYAEEREVENGKLTWIDGQRVVVLRGTPEQMGKAHGELIGYEVGLCIDSILHTHGMIQTLTTGKWFRKELDAAVAEMQPHVPQRFRDENAALATAIMQTPAVIDALNVFPAVFQSSGFVVSGSATTDEKPYLARVLDRPAAIGLHDCATIFMVFPNGKKPFAHVGYAGITGCISGMNQAQIAISHSGFGGEASGKGAPMTTLVRLALEDCSTLAEVTDLWKSIDRIGKYNYILADGKNSLTLAVATSSDSLELIRPGGDHVIFGAGIKDAIVMASGERLKLLRARITDAADKLRAESAIAIMASPVSTGTNLSNILLAPSHQILYVANATHLAPAFEQTYAKIDLKELFRNSK